WRIAVGAIGILSEEPKCHGIPPAGDGVPVCRSVLPAVAAPHHDCQKLPSAILVDAVRAGLAQPTATTLSCSEGHPYLASMASHGSATPHRSPRTVRARTRQ